MASFLRLPRLYPEMEDATIGRWAIPAGESISPHAPIVEIITDKVSYDVEAPEGEGAEGWVLLEACAAEKSVLPVESVLAVLGRPGESTAGLPDWRGENAAIAERRRAEMGGTTSPAAQSAVPAAAAATAGPTAPGAPIRATPAARRAARAAEVTLEDVAAIASGATITEGDVERFLSEKAS